MPDFSHHPLQKAIYQMLSGDSTLSGMITGVFDRPPQGSDFPYITIGESSASDWSSKTTTGMEHNLAIHVWSREGGRKQAAEIMERVHTLLHDANPTVDGQAVIMLRFTGSHVLLENDGWTYHGVMRLRALLEAA